MLEVGVIGCGRRIYGVIHEHLRALAPEIRVTAVLDPDRDGVMARLAPCDREVVKFYDNSGNCHNPIRAAAPQMIRR